MDKKIKDKIDMGKKIRSRNQSQLGAFALVLGILIIIIFIALIPMAQSENKDVVNSVSGLSFLDFILSICGMIIAFRATRMHNDHYILGLIGLIINSVMFFLMISMFLIGL